MDRGWGTPPMVNSFNYEAGHPRSSPDSGKKRKLQYEQLGLPMSKHKFRDRSSNSARGFPPLTHLATEETSEESTNFYRANRKLDDGPEASEGSSKGSSSFVAGDNEVHTEMSSEYPVLARGPGHDDNSFASKLYSLDSRVAKYADSSEKDSDLEDEIQIEEEFKDSDDQLPGLGVCDEDIEECPDTAIEELMFYSNGLASNAFGHPSGRWGIKQDPRMGTRKPTIDQEFEQYFSMLML